MDGDRNKILLLLFYVFFRHLNVSLFDMYKVQTNQFLVYVDTCMSFETFVYFSFMFIAIL